ncbi:MAG TPA: adenylate/guanylate cyclase domain-containing protein [Mycobacteriales bacterium]|nr:adenylate/guanylate cyclase domain-containing protein [Mycobacteriales bacterium]
MALPTGHVTFLFTDIEGSTRHFERLGDAFAALVERHNRLLSTAFEGHGGTVLKTEGDALFVVFPDAGSGVAGALEGQLSLTGDPALRGAGLRVRMGLHTGEAAPRDGDYISLAVNQAARVADAAHGGQVVVTEATAVAAGHEASESLQALGWFRLKDFDTPVRVFQVRHRSLPADFPALRTPAAAGDPLGVSATTIVGRDGDLDELERVVPGTALLTLVGPGGVGKTRLAQALVDRLAPRMPGGAWAVSLADLPDGGDVLPSVARALGVREEAGRSLASSVTDRVRAQPLLLVLDNCEHVLDAVADVVDSILRVAPDARVLATSQAPLGVSGERVRQVEPLTLADAVRLFDARACDRGGRVASNGADRASVEAICRRLDCLPLALELAAARTSALTASDIERRLDSRFQLLGGVRRGGERRHRTLLAVIDWSANLLSAQDRAVLAVLSLFPGDFGPDAAEQLCALAAPRQVELATSITELHDRSLVARRPEGKLYLLESIREYGRGLLRSAGTELDALRHFVQWVTAVAAERDGEPAWYRRLEEQAADLRAAFEYCIANRWASEAAELLRTTRHFVTERSHPSEALALMTRLTELTADGTAEDRMSVTREHAYVRLRIHDHPRDRELAEEALGLARELGDTTSIASAHLLLGHIALFYDEVEAARSCYRAAQHAGGGYLQEWVAIQGLGLVALAEHDVPLAEEHFSLALRRAEESGDEEGRAHACADLAEAALERSDVAAAVRLNQQSLELFSSLGAPMELTEALERAAYAAHVAGLSDPDAIALLAAAAHIREEIGVPTPAAWRARVAQRAGEVESGVPEPERAAARARGRAASTRDAADLAAALMRRTSQA